MGRRRRRKGSDSRLYLARQPAYGTHRADWTEFIQRQIIFTRNGLIPTGEQLQSESIVGGGSDSKNATGRVGGGGDWEFEILPETFIHLMLGWFNPDALPTNVAVADKTIAAADITNTGGVLTFADAVNQRGNAKHAFAYPGQIEITLPDGTSGEQQVIIDGFRRGGEPTAEKFQSIERLTIDGTTAKLTTKHYNEIRSITLPSAITDKPTLIVKPDTQYADLALNTMGDQFQGWTGQMESAVTPFVALDIVPNSWGINVSNNMRLAMNVLCSRVLENRLADDIFTPNYSLPDGMPPKNFGREALNFFPSWGQALVFGNVGETVDQLRARIDGVAPPSITATTDLALAGTHNYVAPEGNSGSRFAGEPIVEGNSVREVTFGSTIFHETDNSTNDPADNETIEWQQLYFDNATFPAIVRFYNWLDDGRQLLIEGSMPNIQLIEVPGLPIEGRGQATRRLAGKSLPSGATPNEVTMRIYSQRGFSEAA